MAETIQRTPLEQAWVKGYEVCECGYYCHIWRASTLKQLPKGYNGELCPQCNLWVCAVDKLNEKPK